MAVLVAGYITDGGMLYIPSMAVARMVARNNRGVSGWMKCEGHLPLIGIGDCISLLLPMVLPIAGLISGRGQSVRICLCIALVLACGAWNLANAGIAR